MPMLWAKSRIGGAACGRGSAVRELVQCSGAAQWGARLRSNLLLSAATVAMFASGARAFIPNVPSMLRPGKFAAKAVASRPGAVIAAARNARGMRMVAASPPSIDQIKGDVLKAPIMDKFELTKEDYIAEYGANVLMFKHKKTGAEIMSVSVPDENKVFGITFRTPPADSTGVPHILEHSVLCGSRKYPVKEPFVELLKGSMNTFLNAFTYPDRTCYPVASQNLKDFYNLINVYLDSVLHPNLTPWTLKQEGWHYETESKDEPLTYKGVVYNEMKGVYSSPDAVHGRAAQQALFPDNTYGVDSGGDPGVIPSLTWEAFSGFHTKFYHPTNSRIYFYGDDDVVARLELLETYLAEFEALPQAPKDSVIAWQKKMTEPRTIEQKYPAGEDGKVLMTVNWLVNDEQLSSQDELALDVLDDLLMGTPVAPLYKSLRESGIGESVLSDGLETVLQQATYSVGVKGISDESKIDDVEKIVLATLSKIADEGFEASAIEASLNSLEFKLREFNTGGFPRGLSFMLGSLSSWLYDRDPTEPLRFEKPLSDLRARLASGEKVFEGLITKYLLENKHKVIVKSFPDTTLEAENTKTEASILEDVKKSLSDTELEALVEETKALKERQEAEDDPEKLALIPTLSMEDLDREGRNIPIEVGSEQGTTVLRHDLPTNGIAYVDIGFDMRVLPLDLLQYVPLFSRCLTEMGTKDMDDIALTRYIQTHTGGVYSSYSTSLKHGSGDVVPEKEVVSHLFVRGKATYAKNGEMFSVMSDMVNNANLDNQAKFTQMVLETKARLEASVVGSGHSYAAGRIGARYNVAEFVGEQTGGIEYLHFIRQLAKDVESDWPSVLAKLEQVRTLLIDRKGMIVNLSAEDKGMGSVQKEMEEYISSIPLRTGDSKVQDWGAEMKKFEGAGEGFIVPTQVNYVGKGAEIYSVGEKTNGASAVVSRYLRSSYLWDKVRVVGGAYGAMNVYQPNSGIFKYVSYRDPNLAKTLKTYDGTSEFLYDLSKDISPATLSNAIIGMVGDMDAPMGPDQKGFTSLDRYLTGLTDESRQARREQVLATTAKDFKEFGERLEAVKDKGTVAVVGSDAALNGANAELKLDLKKLL